MGTHDAWDGPWSQWTGHDEERGAVDHRRAPTGPRRARLECQAGDGVRAGTKRRGHPPLAALVGSEGSGEDGVAPGRAGAPVERSERDAAAVVHPNAPSESALPVTIGREGAYVAPTWA
ncbi:MAG: hypothetical protein D6705_14055 [Deltaproteobacteria bacterium]|nr:MAG: hypothetical protein D6705_14055 [Deltaproteobacteria bacterium]